MIEKIKIKTLIKMKELTTKQLAEINNNLDNPIIKIKYVYEQCI